MLINNPDLDFGKVKGNPSINLSINMVVKKAYTYPDPHKYFILSPIGKSYSVVRNHAILLNPSKGYFQYPFLLSESQADVISISKELFQDSKPLSGKALLALDYALKKAPKQSTSFSNRL